MRNTFYLFIILPYAVTAQNWNGTTVPATISDGYATYLQLTTSGWGGHHALLFNAYPSSPQVAGDLEQYGNTKHTYDVGPYSSGAGAIMFLGNGGNMDFLISDNSAGANNNVNWGAPKMTINRNGNVGIGLLSPGARLSLRTSTSQQGLIISNCDNVGSQSHFGLTTADQSKLGLAAESFLNMYNDGKWNFNSANTSGTTLPISFNTDGNSRLYIRPDGNVGIGTPSPDATLTVKGQIHAQEVKVDLNGAIAPDYVFNKDYQLTSLDSIKNYIDQNKHLPEVPSAKEMEKNGVQLGEMNMLLLKKIEELTLYVIELKREVSELKGNQNTKQ